MDLVDFSKDVYDKIVADYKKMSEALDIKNVVFIPISAKDGDNVVNKSEVIRRHHNKRKGVP